MHDEREQIAVLIQEVVRQMELAPVADEENEVQTDLLLHIRTHVEEAVAVQTALRLMVVAPIVGLLARYHWQLHIHVPESRLLPLQSKNEAAEPLSKRLAAKCIEDCA